MSRAAQRAGIHRSSVYRERQGNPRFAEAMAHAQNRGRAAISTGKAKGRSGTVNTGGYIADTELNWKLRWPLNLEVYDEMRKTDVTCRWMLSLISTPLRAADLSVEPASDEPDDLEAAAFVEHALAEHLDGGLDEFLRQALTYFDFGHSLFERLAELREVEFSYESSQVVYDEAPADPAGTLPPAAPKPRIECQTVDVAREAFVIARLAPRLQRTVEKWIAQPSDSARLRSVEVRPNDGLDPPTAVIPAEQLVVFTHEKEGDDWRGVSLLRSAYKSYRYKKSLENAEAIGIERSVGLPVVYPPEDANDGDLDAIEDAVQALRQGEQLYIIMPGPKAGTTSEGEDGWLIEDLSIQGEGGKAADVDKVISRYDAEMARNVIAEFMRLGHEQTGARATGDVQQDPYYQALEAHAGYIESVLNAAIVKPLVDWNYEAKSYPKLKFSKLQAKNVQVVADSLAKLLSASGVTADAELENWIRRQLDAPERSRELTEEGRPAPAAPTADPATPDPGEAAGPGEAATPEADVMHRFSSWQPTRPLKGAEHFADFAGMATTLDEAVADIPELAANALAPQMASARSLADEAVAKRDLSLLEDIDIDPTPAVEAIQAALERLVATGEADVRGEVRRQSRAMGHGVPGTEIAALPRITISKRELAQTLGLIAVDAGKSAAQASVRAIRSRATRQVTTASDAPDAPGEDPLAAARAAVKGGASSIANKAYALGRQQALRAGRAIAGRAQYSCQLDASACDPCIEADGTVAPADALEPPTPNPECDGGDRCRCTWLPLFGGANEEALTPDEIDEL